MNESVDRDLQVLAAAANYNAWLASMVAPFCRGTVLELGAGLGTHSGALAQLATRCVLTDADPGYCDRLRERAARWPHVTVRPYTLGAPPPPDWESVFDAIVAFNVLEHVEHDATSLELLRIALAPTGVIACVVPALPGLMSAMDVAYGHFRRYDRKGVEALAMRAGLEVVHARYFNVVGLVGWWLRRRTAALEERDVEVFDRWIVPWARRMEHVWAPRVGLSLCFVLRRAR